MSKKAAPGLRPDGNPVTPPDVTRPDGFVADAPLCAILSVDGETAVSGRVTPMGNVQVNLVSPHFNVAIRMNGQMATRLHAGLSALLLKLEAPK